VTPDAGDDALVTRAKRGDPEAWRELHRAHASRLVLWLATRPTGDSGVAPDAVAAEAWLVAASRIADFTGSADDFGGWLFGIARRISATTKRRSERRRTTPGDVGDLLPPVDDLAVDAEHWAWVRSLLVQLPEREREVVALVDCLGVERGQAAEILGISTVALRVARHRGLRRLRASLRPGPGEKASGARTGDPPTGPPSFVELLTDRPRNA